MSPAGFQSLDDVETGAGLYALCRRLFPHFRSLTGDGVRATLADLREVCGLEVHAVPSGTPILDWTVPREWKVREAWIAAPDGRRLADVRDCNLHLVGYSAPFRGRVPLEELRPRLHSLPDRPDWIPYRTSYWTPTWGFCLPHRVVAALPHGDYEVRVDTELFDGEMNWGELLLPGRRPEEIVITTHICHPSMANDNCSGMAIAAALAAHFARRAPTRHALRFLFMPGTVGAIAWLALHRDVVGHIRYVLVLAGLGDPGGLTVKHTRYGADALDAAAVRVARRAGRPLREEPFSPYGYDERQFSSPGFDRPAIVVSRTPFGRYPEYHTSADNLEFIRPEALADSFVYLRDLVVELDGARVPVNQCPYGEPQLGRRGLYDALGGDSHARQRQMAMLWILNLADGRHDIELIRERAALPAPLFDDALAALERAGLIRWMEDPTP